MYTRVTTGDAISASSFKLMKILHDERRLYASKAPKSSSEPRSEIANENQHQRLDYVNTSVS